MKNNMKRFLSIVMAVAMVIVMTAACGSKKEDTVELEEKKTDVSEEQAEEPETEESNAQEEEPVDDTAEMSEEERAVQEEREAINRYSEEVLGIDPNEHKDAVELLGLPEDTMLQLYDMVEQSVRERYLTKYNISPQNKKEEIPLIYCQAPPRIFALAARSLYAPGDIP